MIDYMAGSLREALEKDADDWKIGVPVVPMSERAWSAMCERHGVDKEWSRAEGKRHNADAFIAGTAILFTKPIPAGGV